jgi:hypothetical protein
MNQHEKEMISSLRERASVRLEKSTPGEQAIISMLMVISSQLEAAADTQETLAEQFSRVSSHGWAITVVGPQ